MRDRDKKSDVRIIDILDRRRRPLLSFEFFPPKDHRGFAALEAAIRELRILQPDFVSVTYGAGGTSRARSLAVCELLRDVGYGPVMPHLTCVGATREELEEIVDDIYGRGFRNVMALRGDSPVGEKAFPIVTGGLAHAVDLVRLIRRRHDDMCIGVAGYPETHPEAVSARRDIEYLLLKVEAGADFITSQLFFETHYYLNFVERCRRVGIKCPIIPGLLPAVSLRQVDRIMALCGATFPQRLRKQLEEAGGEGPGAEEKGILWTVRQIDELLQAGAPGIHLYILNRARTALAPQLAECLERWRGE